MPSRTILISGGSRGLGLGFVRHFLHAGDNVATFSRSPTEEIESLQNKASLNARLFYQAVDASDAVALREFVKSVYDRTGRIDARESTTLASPTTACWP